jgi:hypothetical protein
MPLVVGDEEFGQAAFMLHTTNSNSNNHPNTTLRLLHIGPQDEDNYKSAVWSKFETIVPVKLACLEATKRSEISLVKSKDRHLVKINDGEEECYQEEH